MRKITKLFVTKAQSVDDTNKTVRFMISDNKVDRMNEIVDQGTWDFKNYLANPILLWNHSDEPQPEDVLGTTVALETDEKEGATYATVKLDEDINTKAGLVWQQLLRGTLRCVSVGFINKSEGRDGTTPVLKDNELLEISIVPIPANPRAIALAYKEGSINRKDARWLMDSMTKELGYLEKEMQHETNDKEKVMDEKLTNQLGTMMEAITTVAKHQNTTDERIEKLLTALSQKGAVSDVLNADHSWAMDDAKCDLIEPVAAMYYAFCEAFFYSATPLDSFSDLLKEFVGLVGMVVDGSYTADGTGTVAKAAAGIDGERVKSLIQAALDIEPADTPPATDEAGEEVVPAKTDEEEPEVPPAKGGDKDQPGAEEPDEDLDLEGELTPEAQERVDAELEEADA